MKNWILRIFWLILILAALAGAGLVGYRLGYQRGSSEAGFGPSVFMHRFDDQQRFHRDAMPHVMQVPNNRGVDRGFGPGYFQPIIRSRNIGFFSPFRFIFQLALLGLVIWIVYSLFKGNGWQLSFTRNSEKSELQENTTKRKSGKSTG